MEQTAPTGFGEILQENKSSIQKIKDFESMPITTKARNIAFIGVSVGSVAMIGLFASQIISGIFALGLTVVVGGGLIYGVKFMRAMDPVIKQKTKNFVLATMKQEARDNAVTQLDNTVLARDRRLTNAKDARNKVKGMLKSAGDEVNRTDEASPYYKKKVDMLNTFQKMYDNMEIGIKNLYANNKKFEMQVKEFKAFDRFTDLMQQGLSAMAGPDLKLEDMLSLEAFEAIETDFNTTCAEMENYASDMAMEGA